MRRRPSGFTLIELMIGITVIGILSSVALPSYHTFQLRSRQSERTIMLESIRVAVEDYAMREARFPQDMGGGVSSITLLPNPDWTIVSSKRPWRTVPWADHWNQLALIVEGGVYYQYWGTGSSAGPVRQYWLMAEGDLDGDGVNNIVQRWFSYQGTTLQKIAGTNPNWKWTWENDLPAGGGTF